MLMCTSNSLLEFIPDHVISIPFVKEWIHGAASDAADAADDADDVDGIMIDPSLDRLGSVICNSPKKYLADCVVVAVAVVVGIDVAVFVVVVVVVVVVVGRVCGERKKCNTGNV